MTINDLPALNALLNSLAFISMVVAFLAIKRGKRDLHKRFMLLAVTVSICFLASYLIYHGFGEHKVYEGPWPRLYYPILVSHIILAATVPFLVGYLLIVAHRRQFDRHKRIARVGFPIWVYVSITGVVIYFMVHT